MDNDRIVRYANENDGRAAAAEVVAAARKTSSEVAYDAKYGAGDFRREFQHSSKVQLDFEIRKMNDNSLSCMTLFGVFAPTSYFDVGPPKGRQQASRGT